MNDYRKASQYGSYASVMQPFLAGADHVDTKSVKGAVSLDRFLMGMLTYSPWWLRILYGLRAGVAKVLGLNEQRKEADSIDFMPRQISFRTDEKALFFKVRIAKKNEYWIAETPVDKHLKAYVAILAQPAESEYTDFQVVTMVHYKHWTGPVYFNLIRPFHHLVVSRMARAGVSP